jgi:hypothetical protein
MIKPMSNKNPLILEYQVVIFQKPLHKLSKGWD